MKSFRIVLTGGGSGGHVYPLIAVAESLKKTWGTVIGNPLQMYYIGPKDRYETTLEDHDIIVRTISAGKLRRYFSWENFLDIPKFFIGFLQALWNLYVLMPELVFSKGGTGAGPVVIAAWFYRIPVVIHESDAHPGLTNLFSSRFAKKVCLSLNEAAGYFSDDKVVLTGAPIRTEILENRTTQELAKDALGFSSSHPLIFIVGGSQGAMRVNNFILENLQAIISMTQVLHQTGDANFSDVERLAQAALMDVTYENRYQAMGFLDDAGMRNAFTAADVIVTRGSSSSLFEIASFGKPCIIVPHGVGSNDHQLMNARAFAENGAAIVIEETNLLPGIFLGQLKKLIDDKALREKMGAAAQAMFIPNAADLIVGEILKLVL